MNIFLIYANEFINLIFNCIICDKFIVYYCVSYNCSIAFSLIKIVKIILLLLGYLYLIYITLIIHCTYILYTLYINAHIHINNKLSLSSIIIKIGLFSVILNSHASTELNIIQAIYILIYFFYYLENTANISYLIMYDLSLDMNNMWLYFGFYLHNE